MMKTELDEILARHVLWLDADGGACANLCGANLGGANLRGANFGGANLRDANLCGANLGGANLCGANLGGANLCGANLRDANLWDANLRDARVCWQSHTLISEILRRRASDSYELRAVAGMVAHSYDWCWGRLIVEIPEDSHRWIAETLRPYTEGRDDVPEELRATIEKYGL